MRLLVLYEILFTWFFFFFPFWWAISLIYFLCTWIAPLRFLTNFCLLIKNHLINRYVSPLLMFSQYLLFLTLTSTHLLSDYKKIKEKNKEEKNRGRIIMSVYSRFVGENKQVKGPYFFLFSSSFFFLLFIIFMWSLDSHLNFKVEHDRNWKNFNGWVTLLLIK